MKKYLVILLLIGVFVLASNLAVKAYSPHYLPGGKNYISSENIRKVANEIQTINPFLVKTYTEYTFFVSRDYVDGAPFNLTLQIYENDFIVDDMSFSDDVLDFNDDGAYITFVTPADCNYIGFVFTDNGSYVQGTELLGVQLEEGSVPTSYETYVPGSVIDTSSPYFISSGMILSYFDQPITLEEIKNSLTAIDDIDGDLSEFIVVVEDNYTVNNDILGDYSIIFEVSDFSNNTTQLTVMVSVIDILPPVFSNVGEIIAVYGNTFSVQDILSMLNASDNYDGDISTQIELVFDGYTSNSQVVGLYQMEFKVSDSSGNESFYTQDIRVVDDQGPIIGGIDSLSIGYDNYYTISDIISNLTVTDNYDDDSTLEFVLETDGYSSNKSKIGSYILQFSVTDSSGNKTLKNVTVNVVDEIGPVVYFNSSIIQIYTDMVMSLDDFATLLVQTNELSRDSLITIRIRYDSYSKFSNQPGTYHMYLDFEDGYGKVLSKDFEIKVINRPVDHIYLPKESNIINAGFFEKNKSLIVSGGIVSLTTSLNLLWVLKLKKRKAL